MKTYYVVDEEGNVLGSRKEVLTQLGLELLPSGSRNTGSQPPPPSTARTSAPKQRVPVARTSSLRTSATAKPVNNNQRPNPKQLVRCPHCNIKIKQFKLARHITHVHLRTSAYRANSSPIPAKAPASPANASGKATPAPQQSAPAIPSLVKCSVCAANVRSDRLEKHKRKVHSQTSPTPLQSGKQLPTTEWVLCPTCGFKIKPGKLTAHIMDAHRRPSYTRSSSTKTIRQASPLGSERAAKPQADAFEQDSVESRDGGKYLGYMVREHGRYGTLPLYDDYGDESDAE